MKTRSLTLAPTVAVFLSLVTQAASGQNVVAWGADESGQATVPASATNVIAVAAGASNSLALRADGTLIAWGAITNVPNNVGATAIAAGLSHNVVLLTNGNVRAWGNNTLGQTNVPGLATGVIAIAAGNNHTLALRNDGRVTAWGHGGFGQTNVPPQCTNIVAIAAGGDQSLALRDDGECFIWGAGIRKTTRIFRSVNNAVGIFAGTWQQVALTATGPAIGRGAEVPAFLTNLVFMTCSSDYSLGLNAEGAVTGWGNNSLTNVPPSATNLMAIAAGPSHCLAVIAEATAPRFLNAQPAYQAQTFPTCPLPLHARAVGSRPLHYQWLADGIPVPGAESSALNLPAILGTDGVNYQVVVSNDFGAITSAVATVSVRPMKAWGADFNGQTRIPSSLNTTNVLAMAAGAQHGLVLNNNGTVSAWGKNLYGQATVPLTAVGVAAIAAGGNHSLALKTNGLVVAWGDDGYGQIKIPKLLKDVVDIAAGWGNSLALRADGSVVAWGDDQCGQRGINFVGANAIAIASGYWHNMVLRSDGTVATSGLDYPVPRSATNVVAIAAGWETCLALRADGSVIAWGENAQGQCNVPPEATNVVAIASGNHHSLALRRDGSLVVWGMEYCGATVLPQGISEVGAIGAGGDFNLVLAAIGPPRFGRQVTSEVGRESGSVVLSLKVSGKPMSLQWMHESDPIPGATNCFLLLSSLQSSDAGNYSLVASNELGQISSAPIILSVTRGGGSPSGITEWRETPYGRQNSVSGEAQPTCAIAAGGFHRLALRNDGTVVGWGKNTDGQINIPAEATNVVGIAAGSDHSLALRDDGAVLAWGRNWYGQTDVPASATNVVSVAAGWGHSLALKADGTVVGWGNNDYGQTAVSFLAMNVVSIAAGYYHNLALRADGTVVAWGADTTVPIEATNIVAIAAGGGHSLALTGNGTVLAWGDNTYGQINVPATATNVVAIAAGFYHSVALREDGSLIAWGNEKSEPPAVPQRMPDVAGLAAGEDYNLVLVGAGSPQFGRPLRSIVAHAGGQAILQVPLQAASPKSYQWFREGIPIDGATNRVLVLTGLQTALSGNYVLVVSNSIGQVSSPSINLSVQPGSVTQTAVGAWGDNVRGQTDIPPTLLDPKAIAAGGFHSLALQADGTVVAWGKNADGQTNVPPTLTNVIAIAAGSDHSLALKQDGTVVAWGRNWHGQTNIPPAATNVVAISAGITHSVALKDDGTVVAWGDNEYGQTNVSPFATDVIAIAAGYYHTLALRSDHRVVSWGSYSAIPVSASNVVAIAAGWEHSLALRADGTVVAWGDNSYRQCNVPSSATNAVSVFAGYGHSAALLADGTLVAWGTRNYGVTNVPNLLRNVATVAAGENHDLALVEMGAPRPEREPRSASSHVGGRVLFEADVRGTHPLVRQWLRNGQVIPGATNQFLLVTDLQAGVAGDYTLSVSNAIASINGQPATLTVLGSPSITTGFPYRNSPAGQPFSIRAEVSGTPPLSYQWRLNNVDLQNGPRITGVDSDHISIATLDYPDSGDYSLVVSNAQGVVTGLVARLTVSPVLAWGDNGSGQLEVPIGASNIVAISAGGDHNLALRADGQVLAWGDNSFGQSNVPNAASDVVAVAAGGTHSLALLANGHVLAWGDNARGQTNVPARATNIVAIAAGDLHSLALANNGTVLAWGTGLTNVPASATNVVAIAAGEDFSLALRADGSLVAWSTIANNPPFFVIAAGGGHRLALRPGGTIAAWGRNYYGQIAVPKSASNVVSMAAGGDHSLVLRSDGQVIAWGANYSGQTNVPPLATNLIAIAGGGAHTLALINAGNQPLNTAQPPKVAELGESVLLTTTPQVGTVVTYQWQLNGKDLLNATNSALFVSNLHWTNSGTYRVIVSNAFGISIGSPVILTAVRAPLRFDPSSLTATNGFSARLLGASGVGPIVIYASTNLMDWLPIYTNPPVIAPIEFVDVNSNEAERLYRAAELFVPSPIQTALLRDSISEPLRLQVTGLSAASPVTIYVSTNLTNWEAIFTNPPTIGPLEYVDTPLGINQYRFYRASESR